MNNPYFCWLSRLVGEYFAGNYQKLLWKLYTTEYVWELDYDENRAAEGIILRNIYCQEVGWNDDLQSIAPPFESKNEWLESPCSVLEMMIALAKRAEDYIMADPEYGDRTAVWFWDMIHNLGLDKYDDGHFFEPDVDHILDVFLHRKYDIFGHGGAFPVHNSSRDFRQADLWWQLNAYLEERFYA